MPAVALPKAMMPGAPPDTLVSETEITRVPFSQNEIVDPIAWSFSWVPAASGPEL